MFDRFSTRATNVMHAARDEAVACEHAHFGTEHLLLGLFKDAPMARIFEELKFKEEALRREILRLGKRSQPAEIPPQLPFAPSLKTGLGSALDVAQRLRQEEIEPEHLLLALMKDDECTAVRALTNLDVKRTLLRRALFDSMRLEEKMRKAVLVDMPEDFAGMWITVAVDERERSGFTLKALVVSSVSFEDEVRLRLLTPSLPSRALSSDLPETLIIDRASFPYLQFSGRDSGIILSCSHSHLG